MEFWNYKKDNRSGGDFPSDRWQEKDIDAAGGHKIERMQLLRRVILATSIVVLALGIILMLLGQ